MQVYVSPRCANSDCKNRARHGLPSAGTLTTPGLDRGKSCVGLRGVSPRDGYLAQNTTQGTQENLPAAAEARASIRAGLPTF